MSLDIHNALPIEPVAYDDIDLQPNWGERAITIVATSLAVLIVAAIAVLMGMA
jgi:hypothetical protein